MGIEIDINTDEFSKQAMSLGTFRKILADFPDDMPIAVSCSYILETPIFSIRWLVVDSKGVWHDPETVPEDKLKFTHEDVKKVLVIR